MVRLFKKEDIGKIVSLKLDPQKYGIFEKELEEKAVALYVTGTITEVKANYVSIFLGDKNLIGPELTPSRTIDVPYFSVRKYKFL